MGCRLFLIEGGWTKACRQRMDGYMNLTIRLRFWIIQVGGYIRGKYTRVCNRYAPEQTKAVLVRTKEELSWPLSEQAACGWVIGNAWIT